MTSRVLMVWALALPLAGWGGRGHHLAAEASLRTLPPELRAWYLGQEAIFQEAALDPDRWKQEDAKEGHRHYLRVETYGTSSQIPFDAEVAVRLVGASAFTTSGQLPWIIQDRYRSLVVAFRAKDAARIVQESAWLCHYVADAQVPLHTTRNHDGKKTGQKGVHQRWEKGLVEWRVEAMPELAPSRPPKEPSMAAWIWLSEAHALVPGLLEADREALRRVDGARPGRPREDSYWTFFWEQQKEPLTLQLRRSGERTGKLLTAAWNEAGSPGSSK